MAIQQLFAPHEDGLGEETPELWAPDLSLPESVPAGGPAAATTSQVDGEPAAQASAPPVTAEAAEPKPSLDALVATHQLGADEPSPTNLAFMAPTIEDFAAGLKQLPGLSDQSKEYLVDLLRQSAARAQAINPVTAGLDDAAIMARSDVLKDSYVRYKAAIDDLMDRVDGKSLATLVDVDKLAENVFQANIQRLDKNLQTMNARAAVGAPGAVSGHPSLLGKMIGEAWWLGAKVVGGAVNVVKTAAEHHRSRRAEVGRPRPEAEATGLEPLASNEAGDPDIEAWRAQRLHGALTDAEALAKELGLNVGDHEWEDTRGHELLEDLTKSLQDINDMVHDGALNEAEMASVHDRVDHIRNASENAGERAKSEEFKAKLKELADKMVDFVRDILETVKNMVSGKDAIKSVEPDRDANELSGDTVRRPAPHIR